MIELLTCVLNIVLRVKMRHKNQSHLFNNTALLNRFKTGYAKKRNGIVVTITNVMFEIPFMTEKYRETTVYKPQLACPFSAQNSTHFWFQIENADDVEYPILPVCTFSIAVRQATMFVANFKEFGLKQKWLFLQNN